MEHGASILRGLGANLAPAADGTCAAGYFLSCLATRPGAPHSCTCLLTKQTSAFEATAVATTTAVNHHWGLIAAGVLGAFVIYKFVL